MSLICGAEGIALHKLDDSVDGCGTTLRHRGVNGDWFEGNVVGADRVVVIEGQEGAEDPAGGYSCLTGVAGAGRDGDAETASCGDLLVGG